MKREKIRLRLTGLWILFGPVMICMWAAGVNYSNNLVYAILYLVGALTFVSLFHAWRNLASVQVEHVRAQPAFAGGEVEVEIFLRNSGGDHVSNLTFLRVADEDGPRRPLPVRGGTAVCLRPGDSSTVRCVIPAPQRGMYGLGALIVQSAYPFGLVAASFRMPVEMIYYVYPQPAGVAAWPQFHATGEGAARLTSQPGDDFAGVKLYSPGDSLRHVDWKAYARGRPLMIKQFAGGDERQLWLDASHLAPWPLEQRLSQLALWAVNAEQEEIPYGLVLARTVVSVGLGLEHGRRVLEALAVDGGPVPEAGG